MGDIATTWAGGRGTWALGEADLQADDGLQTAVVHSLFCDRLADEDDVPAGAPRRGWCGDALAGIPGDLYGSRLWLLQREKQTPDVLRRAREYAAEALDWLVQDGVAARVDVTAEALPGDVLALQVVVVRNGKATAAFRFERFWKEG